MRTPTMKALAAFERTVQVDGVQTHYYDAGEGDPLVLVHGGGAGMGAAVTWIYNIPQLAKDFRVIAPDLLGYGLTEMSEPPNYSSKAVAEHLVSLLKKLQIKRASLLGWSRGGWFVSYIAIKYPAMVGRLILVNTGFANPNFHPISPSNLNDRRYTRADIKLWHDKLTYRHDLITKEMKDLRFKYGRKNFELNKQRNELYETSAAAHFRDTNIDGKRVTKLLSKIRSPTLIVWSTLNNNPIDMGLFLLNGIESSQMHVFRDAKHEVFIDQYSEFNYLIKTFCKKPI